MGLSYVSCAYYDNVASTTTGRQIVALGSRGRLLSIWVNVKDSAFSSPTPYIFTIKDGGSGGTSIWDSYFLADNTHEYAYGPTPYNFPEHGILFEDGLYAILAGFNGMHAITVTYEGPPAEIFG